MNENAPMLDAALGLAARGFRVLPVWWPVNGGCSCGGDACDSPGKHPITDLVEHGVSQATVEPVYIRRWLDKFPELNIGVRVGESFVVLDFDSPEALSGFETEIPEPLPATLIVQTGRGVHVWLKLPEGAAIQSGRGVLGKDIDIKTGNSYVVAPPSLHSSGRRYFHLSAPDATIAPCPAWLLGRLTREASGNKERGPGIDPARVLEGVPHGERDETLWKYARSLRARGRFSKAEAGALVLLAASRCRPPFDPATAAEKVERAWARSENAARAELARVEAGGAAETEAVAKEPTPGAYAPRCYSLQDLSDKPPAPVKWRVEGLIQGDGITGVIGRPKIGKTIYLEQLALCVAGGVDFLGRKTAPGRVLYIDEEMAPPVVFARWLRMRAAHPSFNAPETLARYYLVSLGGLSIDKPDQIRAEIEKAEPDLLIVDPFRRVYRGQENDSAEVAKAMAFFAALRSEYGLDPVVSHHTRKNLEGSEFWEDAARGSSDFFAACDGLIGLGKRGKGLIEMRATLRAVAEPDPVSLALDEEKLVWDMTSRQPDPSGFDSLKAIEEILSSKPGYRWPQKLVAQALQTDFHRTDKQAEKALSKLSTFKGDSPPPLETRIFKRLLPGTKNEREVILAVAP